MAQKKYKFLKHPFPFIIIAGLLLTLPLGIIMILTGILKIPFAGTNAQIYFDKTQYTLNPDAEANVLINSGDERVGFVRLSLHFDPSQVQLTNEVKVNPIFGTIVSRTPSSEANQTGNLVVVAGVSAGQSFPQGAFVYITLPLTATASLSQSLLSINVADSEVVTADASDMILQATDTTLLAPTPTVSAVPTASPTPSPTVTPTPTPTAAPTLTPVPTPLPSGSTISFEAEDGQLTAPMDLYPDVKASAGYYVMTKVKISGSDTFKFSITTPGQYVVWARVQSVNNKSDSFNVSMDGSSSITFNTAQSGYSSTWQWSVVTSNSLTGKLKKLTTGANSPYLFNLSAGVHTLNFLGREANTKLDKVIITNDLNFKPIN